MGFAISWMISSVQHADASEVGMRSGSLQMKWTFSREPSRARVRHAGLSGPLLSQVPTTRTSRPGTIFLMSPALSIFGGWGLSPCPTFFSSATISHLSLLLFPEIELDDKSSERSL